MVRSETGRRIGRLLGVTALVVVAMLVQAPSLAAGGDELVVTATIPVGDIHVNPTLQGDEVSVDGFGRVLVPGKPNLPAKVFAIAVPPGAEVLDVTAELGTPVELSGSFRVPPAPLPRVIGDEDPALYAQERARYEANYAATYGTGGDYPAQVVELVGRAGYRGYDLADVRVYPVVYEPQAGTMRYYPEITVNVHCRAAARGVAPVADQLVRTERTARELILNYDAAQAWYPHDKAGGRGLHDFVIVTLDSLTSSVAPLVAWETSKGRTVEVVTTSWINTNYTGYDLAEKIRNFLRAKYPSGEWGIEDVLMVGHRSDVPMRRTAQDVGYGQPETDFYYAELSLPDSQSWDSDGDHQWGDSTDAVDYYNEVNVGRIPWSVPATVLHICEKSVAYEQNSDPAFKKNILLLGAFFWDNDPNPRTDNAVLMETKINQPWMADWTKTRLYESGYSLYPMDYNLTYANVLSVWSSGQYAFVNWAGHGSPTSAHVYHGGQPAFVNTGSCTSLNDDYPAIIFADACSNSDTDSTNIGMTMLQQGGVGFVGATKVALGCPGWDAPLDGSSQSLDYYFTTRVTSGEYTQGAAHQAALRDMYVNGLWDYVKYETFEWGALWGNPNLGMTTPTALSVKLLTPPPALMLPGVPMPMTVEIISSSEMYVPDSGLLYYRFDGGEWQTAPLVPDTGNLYTVTLPAADCGQTPECYVAATGDGGTTITDPRDAPVVVYSSGVGEIVVLLSEDFQTQTGWLPTGSTDPQLLDGGWDRGEPVDCNRGDPPTDYDGSGMCYVTDNSDLNQCNSDVDGGYAWLTSPTINLSDGDADIHYALWYTNDFGADPDNDYFNVFVSNNNGSTWVLAQTFGPTTQGGWTEQSFRVGDYVTPTATMKVRFEASDLGSGSVVEAGVDAFRVQRLVCAPLEGACCYADGACAIQSSAGCSGTWLGMGTVCDPNPCPAPQGACCQADGTCAVTEQAGCTGNWLGVGTVCDPNPCPQPWCLGDLDCSGGAPTFEDIKYFAVALGSESSWYQYHRDHKGSDPTCNWLIGDFSTPRDGVEFSDIRPFANSIGTACRPHLP